MFRRSLSYLERLRLAWRKPDKLHGLADMLADHWQLRVVCLVLAFAFWVYVQLFNNKVELTLLIPIAPVKVKENCQALVFTTNGQPLSAIAVKGWCAPQDQDKLRNNDFSVQIDLNDKGEEFISSLRLTASEHVRYIGPERYASLANESLASINSLSPSAVRITIDQTDMKLLAIKPILSGEPAEGYEVSGVTVSPSAVMVQGPVRVLKLLETVATEQIDIHDLSKPLQTIARPALTDASITVVDKTPIEVHVGINTKPVSRTFANIKVLPLGEPARGKGVRFVPTEVAVTLQGVREFIDVSESGSIKAFVDVRDLASSGFSVPIQFMAPPHCNVVSVMPMNVTVNLVEDTQ